MWAQKHHLEVFAKRPTSLRILLYTTGVETLSSPVQAKGRLPAMCSYMSQAYIGTDKVSKIKQPSASLHFLEKC